MDETELQKKLEILQQKIDATFESAEKTRKYFLILLIGSAAVFVLPLIGLLFAVPSFISTYSDIVNMQ